MLCIGDMYLSSLFVCRRSLCQTAPPGVRDALGYVQVLFLQFCAGQGHLDSVPGAVEDPGMICLIHHGVMKIPLVRLLPITFNVRCPVLHIDTFSLLFSMDTPIPHFLFMNLYSYSFYPFITFSPFSFSHSFLVCIGDDALAQGTLVPRSSEPFFSYFLAHGPCIAAVGKGTYKLCCVQCIIILVLHDSSKLFVGGGLNHRGPC